MVTSKESITEWLRALQDQICKSLSEADGGGSFSADEWKRPEGGGGLTRIFSNGKVIEKGGVNFSAVHGEAPEFLLRETHFREDDNEDQPKPSFYATGVSVVMHPRSPMVPIIHMNVRYFEMDGGVRWLGGGIDLTPHYVDENDAKFFHGELKKVCDRHNEFYYANYKKWADNYFFIRHRGECRGIGGIFFDRLNEDEHMMFEKNLAFWKDVGSALAPIYTELIKRNKDKPFSNDQKRWQLLRRGRYVEFNLVYDRGTRFGLETNGRVESILMSLPLTASWEYNYVPKPGSPEAKTLDVLRDAREWLG
jgi:coproporphyrinogen III oxidase